MMEAVKFVFGMVIFLALYFLIDLVAGLIPMWVGMVFLLGIIAALIRLAFLIAKEANK